MYTNCPECGTVFRISTTELRVAEGFVRCGHCSATFNAVATLADVLPPTVTLKQLTLPTESGTGVPDEPEAPPGESDREPTDLPGFPSEPPTQLTPPELQVAATYVPLPISEDTLEFDIPEDSWSKFFAASGTEATTRPAHQPDDEPEPEPEPASAADPDDPGSRSQTDIGTGIGSETMDQAGIYRALSAEGEYPEVTTDGDWEGLLGEVHDDVVSPPQPVYVIGEDHAGEPGAEPEFPAASWDGQESGSNRPPAPLPADFAVDFPATGPAGESLDTTPESGAAMGTGVSVGHQPFLWKAPAPPESARSGRQWVYIGGSVLLALLLLIQVLHQQREALATNPALTAPLQRLYGAFGLPLWPAWNVRAYELRNSEAVADRTHRGALDILARIAVVGTDPVGLPLVRVTLRDRLSRPIGSRVFHPEEYLGANSRPRALVTPGTLIPVEVSLQDPGADAQGFDVDVCVMDRREGIVCRAEREPFVR